MSWKDTLKDVVFFVVEIVWKSLKLLEKVWNCLKMLRDCLEEDLWWLQNFLDCSKTSSKFPLEDDFKVLKF